MDLTQIKAKIKNFLASIHQDIEELEKKGDVKPPVQPENPPVVTDVTPPIDQSKITTTGLPTDNAV